LPLPPTALVGREREVADLVRLLAVERSPLVTIVGPGGIGKTRLALEVAANAAPDFRDGVSFVDLSAVREPELVQPTLVAQFDLHGRLVDQRRGRELLLVLDSVEQTVEIGVDLAAWREAPPRLAVLVTSREPLRLRAEVEYPLQPLPEDAAVELFRERARTID